MRKRLFVFFVPALVGAVLIAGCGGGSDSGGTASLSKAEFIKRADAICKKSEGRDEKEFEEFLEEEGVSKNERPSKKLQERAIEEVAVPSTAKQLEEIRALGFPEGKDGEEAEAVVESAEADVEEAEKEPSALFSENAFKQTDKKAREYGLEVCGSEG